MNTNNAVLTVLILGLAVFGLIIFVRGYENNSSNQTVSTPNLNTQSSQVDVNETLTPKISTTPSLKKQSSLQYKLLSLNNTYGQSGVVVLSETSGKVKVSITVNAVPDLNDPQPAHIHTGTCSTPGKIVYSLNNLIKGQSTTILNTTLANLKSKEPLILNIHKSESESNMYTTCGVLTK